MSESRFELLPGTGFVGALARRPFFCGDFSLADIAVAPHVMAATFLGFSLDPAKHPRLTAWMAAGDGQAAFDPYQIQWRSDRLEWVVKNGFADWFADEVRAGRAFFPVAVAR